MQWTCFDPTINDYKELPRVPGIYAFCLRKNMILDIPLVFQNFNVQYNSFKGLDLLYAGRALTNLRNRDYKKHLENNKSGWSTLRRSLAVLLFYDLLFSGQIMLSRDTKVEFSLLNEVELSQKMKDLLIMYYTIDIEKSEIKEFEKSFIKENNPLLNIGDNPNAINREFRSKLSDYRTKIVFRK